MQGGVEIRLEIKQVFYLKSTSFFLLLLNFEVSKNLSFEHLHNVQSGCCKLWLLVVELIPSVKDMFRNEPCDRISFPCVRKTVRELGVWI